MKLNYGQIVEKRVRQSGYSVTKLAHLVNVNRRSVYNWFNQENLNSIIIYRIGRAINHNFSMDFPELSFNNDFKTEENNMGLPATEVRNNVVAKAPGAKADENFWKDKYIVLLKKYSELLTSKT